MQYSSLLREVFLDFHETPQYVLYLGSKTPLVDFNYRRLY